MSQARTDYDGPDSLVITSDGGVNDFAERDLQATLPVAIETKARLVSGGANYRLPWLDLYFCDDRIVRTGYAFDPSAPLSFGWFLGWYPDGWTGSHVAAPASEDVWTTTRIVLRPASGELYAQDSGTGLFVLVASKTWSIDDQIVRVQVVQPWDAIIEVDYIKMKELPR